MNSEATFVTPSVDDDFHPYRAVSKAALVAPLLGFLSLLVAFLMPEMLVVPFTGLLFGLVAVRNLRTYPDELTGWIPAVGGASFCGLVLMGGAVFHVVDYATEVPDGYERIAFNSLLAPSSGAQVPPADTLQLDGKKVFVKGYIHPSVEGMGGIRKFVLVPDLGTCCFGGEPPLTHMIEVSVKGRTLVEYSRRKRGLAGVLRVDRQLKPITGLNGVYYQLEAEYVK